MKPWPWILALALLGGCGDDRLRPVQPDAGPAGCSPLIGDDCLSPFPSTLQETADATASTGFRVALRPELLPETASGTATDVTRMNQRDGFSPATPFLVYFAAGVDATQLPAVGAAADSLLPAAPVQVLDYQTGERVPVFAELDANAFSGQRQGLIIRPLVRLKPATRYVVALVGLRDATGKPLVPAGFAALREGGSLGPDLAPLAARYREIFAALTRAGVARASLTLAWDVVTASDATATSHLIGMRDTAFAMAPTLGYTITSSTDTPGDSYRAREILATVQVPSFLTSDDGLGTMHFGPGGQPAVRALTDVPIVIEIPRCAQAATRPLPYLVYGHGLFGGAQESLENPGLLAIANRLCMVMIATDWIGLSFNDIGTVANNVALDLNKIGLVTDRLQQAQVNAQVMALIYRTKMVNDAALMLNGAAISDGREGYYFGISLGGIQGTTFMALSPDVVRGVLNVPGCEWSLLMFRSTDFNQLYPLLNLVYPDPFDRQVLVTLSQSEWDYTDPASFAPHLLHDPLPNTPAKHILVQQSMGDAQVTNIATEILARTMGLPGLDLERPVLGVTEMPGPLDSAYTQWDVDPTPLPPIGNTPAPKDNGAHDAISGLPLLQAQIAAFLTPTGQVTQTCTGPCNFPR